MPTAIPLLNSWVWFLTTPQGDGVTFLNKLVSDAQIDYVLNASAQWTGGVPSDNPEVNIPYTDGDPFVSYNNRLLYGLRREGRFGEPKMYVCRYSGLIQIAEDEAGTDEPVTHLTAYDPWMWLNSIPVFTSGGDLLPKEGLSFTATPGSTIAQNLLTWALAVVVAENPTNPLYIDEASGHFDTTDVIDIEFSQGITVGEAWTQLVDTGSMDIVLTPIYDPHVRPGKLSVLNIYSTAGAAKDGAIFAWDKMPHSLSKYDRLMDGTQMVNVAQLYYNNNSPATQAADATSIAAYGQFWAQQNYPAPSAKSAIDALALAQVALRKRGKMTITVDPDPSRSPDPFTEYYLGDRVPVYAGRPMVGGGYSSRAQLSPGDVVAGEWSNPQRIFGFSVTLDNDQQETVAQLLMTDNNTTFPT